jgi:DNA-binding winged helix-turn-helix (wHTH) protein/Tol biopolymer transport system component
MSEPDLATRVIRFGVFEVDLRSAELRKQGVRIRLPGQSFQVLEALLLRPGELVTREELKQKLWPSDSFGDFEHGLNAAVNRVREALGDSSDNPRFVETLPRRGYRFIAPVQQEEPNTAVKAPPLQNEPTLPASDPVAAASPAIGDRARPSAWHRWIAVALAAIAVLAIALVVIWWRMPRAVPVVESVVQLTNDGQPKDSIVSDGSRIYFNQGTYFSRKIAQVSVRGGPTAPVENPFATSWIYSITKDGSALLVVVPNGPPTAGPSWFLWSVPLPAGEPRRFSGFETEDVDAFPDGRIVFSQYFEGKDPKGTDSRTDYFIANKDGSNTRKLVSFPGPIGALNVSPDGQRIVLTQELVGDRRLFQIAADGTGLREIRKLSNEGVFNWTPDEKYLVYQSGNGVQSDIWLLPISAGLFRRPGKPIRLTNGPMPYSDPYPSRDGKQIFVSGATQRGELVRYDMKSHQFVPFLSGISATDPTFSRDGKWVAYVSYPDDTLWRSRSDGTERIQLTYPPMDVKFPMISPDGTKVSFHTSGQGGDLYVISMDGGKPQKVADTAWYGSWSPDGNDLVYGNSNWPFKVHVIDLRTGTSPVVPPPFGNFWVSQDTLVARNEKQTNFVTFNLKTQQQHDLAPGPLGDIETWMLSPDAKYIYFTTKGADPKAMRLRVADHQLETITSIKDLNRTMNNEGEINVAPDGSPIFTRDTGYQEIYALNMRWP